MVRDALLGISELIAGFALIIGSDACSRFTNWTDRTTCMLFGDGAGAVVLASSSGKKGILASWLKADGDLGKNIAMPGGGSRDPELEKVRVEHSHGQTWVVGK